MGAGQSGCQVNYYKENEDDEECIPVPVPCDVKKYRLTKGGSCRPIPVEGCPVNQYRSSKTESCKAVTTSCPPNKYKKTDSGSCIDIPVLSPGCPPGTYKNDNDNCVSLPTDCKQGEYKNSLDECVPFPKIKAIDLESNLKGSQIIDSIDHTIGCTLPSGKTVADDHVNKGLHKRWCGGNYNYILPAGMLPNCRGGKAQRVCYEPATNNVGDNYHLAIKGIDDTGSCTASDWKPINSANDTNLIDDECKKVIDLLDTDKTKLPKKVDAKGLHTVCNNNNDCRSGVCTKSGNNFTSLTTKYGELVDDDTTGNGLCTEGTRPVDADCLFDEACRSRSCDTTTNKCVHGDIAIGSPCANNDECSSGKCDTTTNKCVAGETAIGSSCIINEACKSGKCVAKTCVQGDKGIEASCTYNDECASSNCDTTKNKCVKGSTDIAGSCNSNDVCLSLRCVGNICVQGDKAIGSSCTGNKECASSNCDNTGGQATNKCVAATVSSFSNYSGNLDTYDKTKPIDTLILVFVILMILFLLFRICKRLKVMK